LVSFSLASVVGSAKGTLGSGGAGGAGGTLGPSFTPGKAGGNGAAVSAPLAGFGAEGRAKIIYLQTPTAFASSSADGAGNFPNSGFATSPSAAGFKQSL
jgi:hypothetical protein